MDDEIGDSQELMDICQTAEMAYCGKDDVSWRGAPMTEIYGGKDPWEADEFPKVNFSYNHAVLYHIPTADDWERITAPPEPFKGRDIWDRNHVRMPHSNQSLYPVEENGKTEIKNRWNLVVEALSKPINNSHELESAILSYNSKYAKQWKLRGLHELFNEYLEEEETEHFFKNTLPLISDLALKLPELIPNAIPLLRQNHNRSVSLSQQQVSCLLANAFFCTFPRRNSQKAKSEYITFPEINFNRLFQIGGSIAVMEKIKSICHYFRRVCSNVPCGAITFTRHCVDIKSYPNWSQSDVYIGSLPLHIDSEGTIEDDGVGLLQVDFANKFLGGGVLGQGCVQEEIRFVICPELLVSMLFTEVLKPNEALLMIGCERFSDYEGYADSFTWSGNHIDATKRDSSGRLRCAIVAIDALRFTNSADQYRTEFINRELNKAFVGFSLYSKVGSLELAYPGVATGNWGCGAFCGSPHIKSLIQLIVCCITRRPIAYYTFKDSNLRDDVADMYNFLTINNITIGKLYSILCEFRSSSKSDLYTFIKESCKEKPKVPSVTNRPSSDSAKPKSVGISTKSFYGSSFKAIPDDGEDSLDSYDTESKIQGTSKSEDAVEPPNHSKLSLLESESHASDSGSQSKNSSMKKKFLSYFDKHADDNAANSSVLIQVNVENEVKRNECKGDKKPYKITDFFKKQ